MTGIKLIIIMGIVGGLIAYIGDKLGSKIGKKRMSVFGLRPKHTSVLLTVISGALISVVTIGVMAIFSENARTALFGMEELTQEIRLLNQEKETAVKKLADAKAEFDKQNAIILSLDTKIKQSEDAKAQLDVKYARSQESLQQLSIAKAQLRTEVEELEEITDHLRKNVISMREGQVFYRAGEVVYAGVLRSGLSHEENLAQLNWLLTNANDTILRRLGLQNDDNKLQAIWLSKKSVDQAILTLDTSDSNMLYRVRAMANVVVGELVVCDIEITENELIYSDGDLIYSEVVDLNQTELAHDTILMNFLSKINHVVVEAGVLQDPISGKVGNIDAHTMLETTNTMRKLGDRVVIKAYANGDITTAGLVHLKLEVVRDDE